MSPKKTNHTLLILGLVMLINALSYGIIIPLMYPYASKFGIDPLRLSFLFASFSLAQFIATPIIGRLSDKYGRKPLLLICLAGTSISLALFASAQSAIMLFVARILDGITGGNNSVAQAVIADSTEGKDRARAFGILGAAFGLGFLLGPALGGVLSNYGLTVPFWFASGLALIGTIAGVFLLKETLPPNSRQSPGSSFLTPKALLEAFLQPLTGIVLVISLFYTIGLNSWILGFQSFTNDVLRLSTQQIGLLFALFGLVTVIMQGWGVGVILKKIASKKRILIGSLFLSVLSVIPMFITNTFIPFTTFIIIFAIVSAPIGPVISALLSERTKAEDQGGIMGINQAVISLGQIFGPLLAGAVSQTSIHLIFLMSAGIMLISTVAGKWLYIPVENKVDL